MLLKSLLCLLLINCLVLVPRAQDACSEEGAIEEWDNCPKNNFFCGHCTYFSKCQNGQYKPTPCPENPEDNFFPILEGGYKINVFSAQVFDPDRKECVKGNITAPLAPNTCNSYTECLVINTNKTINPRIKHYQQLTELRCPGSSYFDPVLKQCTDTNPSCESKVCTKTTCLNGGECEEAGNDNFMCYCENGWSGTRCEIKNHLCESDSSCDPGYECFSSQGQIGCIKMNYDFQKMDEVVMSIAFGSGNILASALSNGTIRLWDIETEKLSDTLNHPFGSTDKATVPASFDTKVALSFNGILASSSFDKTIRTWDPATGNMLNELKGHTGDITNIAFRSDDILASSSADKTVNIWNGISGELLKTCVEHEDTVTSIAFSENKLLASGSADKTVMLWNATESWDLVMTLADHTDSITSVAFLNETVLASGSADKTVKLWNVSTGRLLRTLNHTDVVTSIAFSSDGFLVSGSGSNGDGLIQLWDPDTGDLLNEYRAEPTGDVRNIVFIKDDILVVASGNSIKQWDLFGEKVKMTASDQDKLDEVSLNENNNV